MQHRLSIQDVAHTMFIYPTFAELAKKPITRYLRAYEPSDLIDGVNTLERG